ncbi:sensor histidine kinase [Agarivorans sp. 1_MG-2023]|uniref:sensor histidine kinase n=1 Tax=Agarivorans sp. 1_MG-2023 TaxID=3062634 RepID=UPI0026E3A5C4|nr:histidine kinase [Agarivorans sp. 1_MG-2023]MDO6764430.1 histidine kinase [Agarivorans sp. 1_MG-2023]
MKSNCYKSLGRSLAICALFSIPIAYLTNAIWGGPYWMHFIIALVFGCVGTMATMLIDWLFPKLDTFWSFVLSAPITLSLGSAHTWYWISPYYDNFNWPLMLKVVLIGLLFCAAIYYYFFSREQNLEMSSALQTAELEKLKAEQALTYSQLQLLQSQIEPHFLFNTLANLKALIAVEPKQAEVLLDKFTELLRVTLKKSRQESIRLEDEVAGISAYLAIQQIRLGERLQFNIELDSPNLTQQQIPPMLLQPLVENAVFHGIEPKPEGGDVSVHIAMQDQRWKIAISDTGIGFQPSPKQGNGMALANIQQRLASLYPNQASLSISPQASGGTLATLEFPCEQ